MVLLTLHSRLGRWLQTGGHIEPNDPTLEAAAVREAYEESGLADLSLDPTPLALSTHEVPCGPLRPTYHLDVQYLAIANGVTSPRIGNESLDVRWFVHSQLPEDGSVVALVRAASVRLGW
jgi:8-oxo-dGTP pyrophosphatase MutT (NUDIX family)